VADISDVMLLLGSVQTSVERLREDFKEEKDAAHESRAVIHRRLDEHVGVISSIKTDVAISAEVDAQVRNELKALQDTVKDSITPAVDDWKRMKSIGVGLAGLLALGGLSLGAVLIWMGETAATVIKRWLGL
jgi:hypothetical protein